MRNTHRILASGIAACSSHLSYFFCLSDGIYTARTPLKSCCEVLLWLRPFCQQIALLSPSPLILHAQKRKAKRSSKFQGESRYLCRPTFRYLMIPSQHSLLCAVTVIIAQHVITDSAPLLNEEKPLHPGVCKREQLTGRIFLL